MIPILYEASDFSTDYDVYGDHQGYYLSDTISCIVSRYGTIGWDLELEYPVNGQWWDLIVQRNFIVMKASSEVNLEPFRIIRVRKDISGHIKVTAQHLVYDLKGIPVAPFTASTASEAMSRAKTNSMVTNPFTLSSDKVATVPFAVLVPTSAWDILGNGDDSIVSVYGTAEFDITGTSVVLKDRLGADNGVKIEYGVNMTEFEQDESTEKCYTGAVAYWSREVNDQLEEVHTDVVNVSGTFNFTNIITYDFTSSFDEKPTKQELTSFLQAYMTLNNIGKPEVNFDISFVDLSKTSEYADISNLYAVNFGDTVTVKFPKYSVDIGARVCETKWDVLKERYSSISLGDYKANVADTIAEQAKEIAKLK